MPHKAFSVLTNANLRTTMIAAQIMPTKPPLSTTHGSGHSDACVTGSGMIVDKGAWNETRARIVYC